MEYTGPYSVQNQPNATYIHPSTKNNPYIKNDVSLSS